MLRLYSPVVGVMKKMAETTTLEDGRTVRAGTILNISFLQNHLNEEVYPDAGKFRLKRFLVDEVDKKLCLGQHLARLEMKMFTVELLRHYELTRGSRPSGFLKFPIYMATPHIRLSKCDALRQWQQQQQMAVKQEQMLANAAVRNKKEEYNASPKLAQKPSVDARRAVMMSKKKGLF
ncbi:cytochrome P450 [Chytridium lagenaria]|nr:cytochrome P450 [Chytridium lagenaria]